MAAVAKWSLHQLAAAPCENRGRLIKHARNYWLPLAESDPTRRRFGGMLARIALLQFPAE